MANTKVDLILHPARLRMLLCFSNQTSLNVQQLTERLPDIPKPTIYRHLSKLVDAGILSVVDEKPIRGAVEKTYALSTFHGVLTADDLRGATKEDHFRYFMNFLTLQMEVFGRYLNEERIDLEKDGVGYRQLNLYLDESELTGFVQDLRQIVNKYAQLEPTTHRRCRSFSTIIIPENQK